MKTVTRPRRSAPLPGGRPRSAILNPTRQGAALLSCLLFGTGGFLAGAFGLDEAAPWLPFLISIAVVGLPHGAADWMLLRPATPGVAIRDFLLYALAGGLIGVFAVRFPVAAVLGFFVLTVLHFGIADERDLREWGGAGSRIPAPFRFGGVARAGVFLGLVCYVDAEGVALLFGDVMGFFGHPDRAEELRILVERGAAGALLLASLAWLASMSGRLLAGRGDGGGNRRTQRAVVEVGEMVLLVAAALFLDPVFVVGLYFLTWHALRHCQLVASRMETGSNRWTALTLLHLRGWPLALPVILGMALLVGARGALHSPRDWIAALLAACLVFTLPHHLIVERKLGAPGSPDPARGRDHS